MWLQQDFYDRRIPRLDRGVNHPRWRGTKVRKFPTDLILYAQVIYKNRPDWIVECGSAEGGSALFFSDMQSLFGAGRVISIDVRKPVVSHPRLHLIEASSTDPATTAWVRETVRGKVMVTLDSDHGTEHVYRELCCYAPIVTLGQYLVCEDTYRRGRRLRRGPGDAIARFLEEQSEFVMEHVDDQFFYGCTRGGWLRRRSST